jgi:hypothetical protein
MAPLGRPAVPLLVCTSAVLLLLAAPGPGTAWVALQGAPRAADPFAPVLAGITLVAWLLVAWLMTTVLVTAGGHLPGRLGSRLAAAARLVAPAAVRRAVELSLGLTVLVGALTTPASAAPTPAASLDWPVSRTVPGADAAPGETADPGANHVGTGSGTAPDLDWAPAAPPAVAPAGTVVVQPGDTLWDLAAADLEARTGAAPADAQVASAWPSWWAVNRDAVGADPDLLHPGTPLRPPPSA